SNTTVTANVVTCPAGAGSGATCYQALLTKTVPVGLAGIVGFVGDKGGGKQGIMASAIASTAASGGGASDACLWTLSASSGTSYSLTANGTPKSNLNGCSVMSNGSTNCNGANSNMQAGYFVVVGSASNGCTGNTGTGQQTVSTAPTDPYDQLKNSIDGNFDVDNCSKGKTTITSLPVGKKIKYCGDLTLGGDVIMNNNIIVIYDGALILGNNTLSTAANAGATVIFSSNGAAGATAYYPITSNKSSLNISPTTSGPWKGVSIYQDPRMSPAQTLLDVNYAGNKGQWNVSGVVYLPKSNVTISGAMNKDATPTCRVLISYTLQINGNGSFVTDPATCHANGIQVPSVGGGTTVRLVQ
ncbi:MAG: hypothetical protein JSS15_09010, partial [Proteobacteria bacterium]|nr:hypothetical protein [Pseudomonadota bacterium]